MTKHLNTDEQTLLFNQPVEVPVELDCSVERASELVKRSKSHIYHQLSRNKLCERKVNTGIWRVRETSKHDRTILVSVSFVFSPSENSWTLA